jgi:hypothetical protein
MGTSRVNRTSSPLRLRNVLVGAAIVAGCAAAVLVTSGDDRPVMAAAQLNTASTLATAPATAAVAVPNAAVDPNAVVDPSAVVDPNAVVDPTVRPSAASSIESAATTPGAPTGSTVTGSGTTPEPSAAPDPAVPSAAPPAATAGAQVDRPLHTTGTVNVRDTPGPTGAVVVVLDGGQSVVGGQPADGWVPVHVGDVVGWVSADYLADGTAPAAAPLPEPAAASGSSGNWMTDLLPQVDPGGIATWVFERNGSWGASDGHTVWIDPDLPSDKRLSVMVHEYSHALQVRVYGSMDASVAGLSALIGGGTNDVTANESTADCMALALGATWINYGCSDSLQAAASAILAGQRP